MYGHLKYHKIKKLTAIFLALKTPYDLSCLLRLPLYKINLLLVKSDYHTFTIRKKGGQRRIDEPQGELQKLQVVMKNYLQSVYYFHKTDAAYGYILSTSHDNPPRNIISNAWQHRNSNFMLNIDLSDFFHFVTTEKLKQVFSSYPFEFPENLSRLITRLVTFNGSLPMGSPTSPVLSNFAMLRPDYQLLEWARGKKITYTRFVDDLTFSSGSEIDFNQYHHIESTITEYGYRINHEKVQSFTKDEPKIVTGLQVTDKVVLPDIHFEQLEKDIADYASTKALYCRYAGYKNREKTIRRIEQMIAGKINFIGMVYGYDSKQYRKYINRYNNILATVYEEEARSWLDFPYQF